MASYSLIIIALYRFYCYGFYQKYLLTKMCEKIEFHEGIQLLQALKCCMKNIYFTIEA